jgi:secondary thiamine-phosphate synthase enzyme
MISRPFLHAALSEMRVISELFSVPTRGRGTTEITGQVEKIVRASKIRAGIATIFVRHTSASLIIFENADPSARADLEEYFNRLVPESTPWFQHTLEGADDMPSHIRMTLTRTSEIVPIQEGRLALGTWQGIYVFEHRLQPHMRQIAVSIVGE